METCHSDLRKFCESPQVVDLDLVKRLMWTLLLGLTYLHSACVWHRDLKPGNCLLTEQWSVKIADFGLARAVGRTQQFHQRGPEGHATLYNREGNSGLRRDLTRQVGTRVYRAPEMILRQRRYSEMVDVWSAGCVYGELLWTAAGAEGRGRRGHTLFHGGACCPRPDECRAAQGWDPSKDLLSSVFDLIGTPSEERRCSGPRTRGPGSTCAASSRARAAASRRSFRTRTRMGKAPSSSCGARCASTPTRGSRRGSCCATDRDI
ncbi:unnamed protein product [Prorocentrum cordatum]|uniref:Protein kinase domain-containing protein n=1 Tax=Prorocentrum cordatum TaxID=2364126 RepID=A0ABN9PUN0_9DINO|nr:unnamed protein product [Polarella glacialis]